MKTTIKATPNYKKRSFTIQKIQDGKIISKYQALPMTPDEFNEAEYNTSNDWHF